LSINDFVIESQLGAGQFGVVWKALEKYSNKHVALKVINKSLVSKPEDLQRLKREIAIQSRLRHVSICQLYGYFQDAKNVYIVLEYCSNGNLASRGNFLNIQLNLANRHFRTEK